MGYFPILLLIIIISIIFLVQEVKTYVDINNSTTNGNTTDDIIINNSTTNGNTTNDDINNNTTTNVNTNTTNNIMCNGLYYNDVNICNGNGECVSPNQCQCYNNGSDYGGNDCEIQKCFGVLQTTSNVCSSRGSCVKVDKCLCDDVTMYGGEKCEIPKCYNVLQTDLSVCSGNGRCLNDHTCVCFDEYLFGGYNCHKPKCFGYYQGNLSACSGNGVCSNSHSCICYDKFGGKECSTPKCNDKLQDSYSVCSMNGICLENHTCFCNADFEGKDCEIPKCFGLIPTNSDVCSGRGRCLDLNVCSCNALYGGEKCEIPKCNDKLQDSYSVCSMNGICLENHTCFCKPDFGGKDCEIPKCFGLIQTNTDVCSGRGRCLDVNVCSCNDLYGGGEMCEIPKCNGVLKGRQDVCSGNGICLDNNSCLCTKLYEGINCEIKRNQKTTNDINIDYYVSKGIELLKANQDFYGNGFLLSHIGTNDIDEYGFSYDQALTAILFIKQGEYERARRILDRFYEISIFRLDVPGQGLIKHVVSSCSDCLYYFSAYDVTKSSPSPIEYVTHSGFNAWIVLSFLYYYFKRNNFEPEKCEIYLELAKQIGNQAIDLIEEVTGGVKLDLIEPWISTEHNADWLSTFTILYQLTKEEKYDIARSKVLNFINNHAYYAQKKYFRRGHDDNIVASDVTTCVLLATDFNVDIPISIRELLTVFEEFVLLPQLGLLDFTDPTNMERDGMGSLEWTAQYCLVLKKANISIGLKYDDCIKAIINQVVNSTIGESQYLGIKYATKKFELTFSDGWRTPNTEMSSVAPIAWFIFAVKGYNPFIDFMKCDDAEKAICGNNGKCFVSINGIKWYSFYILIHIFINSDCENGYGGMFCKPICNNIVATNPTVCNGEGNCTAPEKCICKEGYRGNDCEIPKCFENFEVFETKLNKVLNRNNFVVATIVLIVIILVISIFIIIFFMICFVKKRVVNKPKINNSNSNVNQTGGSSANITGSSSTFINQTGGSILQIDRQHAGVELVEPITTNGRNENININQNNLNGIIVQNMDVSKKIDEKVEKIYETFCDEKSGVDEINVIMKYLKDSRYDIWKEFKQIRKHIDDIKVKFVSNENSSSYGNEMTLLNEIMNSLKIIDTRNDNTYKDLHKGINEFKEILNYINDSHCDVRNYIEILVNHVKDGRLSNGKNDMEIYEKATIRSLKTLNILRHMLNVIIKDDFIKNKDILDSYREIFQTDLQRAIRKQEQINIRNQNITCNEKNERETIVQIDDKERLLNSSQI